MTPAETSTASASATALAGAVATGDLERAEGILSAMKEPISAAALAAAAELHLRRKRWGAAAELLARIDQPDANQQVKRFLARNLAAMQEHRPQVYRTLMSAGSSQRYQFIGGKDGRAVIVNVDDPAHPLVLSPGGDPLRAVNDAMRQLQSIRSNGSAIGLCSIGDAYLLSALAQHPPKLFLDQQQIIHVIEPDPHLVLACMMILDLSGPRGPIEQQRFRWYVGSQWLHAYENAALNDLYLPAPAAFVSLGPQGELIRRSIERFGAKVNALGEGFKAEIKSYYTALSRQELIAVFGDQPQRRPRVLFMTSRFTTVLQYATRDAAEGFRRIGWDAEVLIEPSPYHRATVLSTLEAVARFKPDLIFQIDHQRHEHGEVFPPNVPFACWIQDLLTNLTSTAAGAAVKQRDYVLTFATPMFVQTYGYPPRQCIDMPMMMTLPPKLPAKWTSDGEDLVYVSNLSQPPAQLMKQVTSQAPESARALVDACAQRMIELYEAGQSLASFHDLHALLDEVRRQSAHAPLADAALHRAIELLWNPLNITLYRQQGLAWVADAAKDLGLTLALFGNGWEANPAFTAMARGPVRHGRPLQELTRRARINLNLEPYPCFTHHRLLDGLVAGGFFLVRRHPANTMLQALANYLDEQFDDAVQSVEDARQAVQPAQRDALEDILHRSACVNFGQMTDPIRQVRCWQRAGVLVRQASALPRLDEVSFDDSATCRALIASFIDDEPRRRQITDEQRRNVEDRLSFPAGMQRVVRRIRQLLIEEQA